MNDKLIEQIKIILFSVFSKSCHNIDKIINDGNVFIIYFYGETHNNNYTITYTADFTLCDDTLILNEDIVNSNIKIYLHECSEYIIESLNNISVVFQLSFIQTSSYYFYDNTLITTDDIKEYKINRNLKLLNKV